jgi:predicted protein tyrosine phosphatase
MFEIKVLGLTESYHCIAAHWPTRVLSVLDQPMPEGVANHLHVWVDDIWAPQDGKIHCTAAHITQILDFTATLTDDDRLLVHCVLGINRSTAAAIGILIQHGMDYDTAYYTIAEQRPQLYPNKLMIKLIDQHFNLAGSLFHFVNETPGPS